MKRLLIAPLLLLGWITPASASTAPIPLTYHDLPRACTRLVKPHTRQNESLPRCIGGIVMTASTLGMKLNLAKGPDLKVLFSNKTTFVTESATASLVGLAMGDFACVEGTVKDHVLTAIEVLFDTDPFPCGPARKTAHKTDLPVDSAAG